MSRLLVITLLTLPLMSFSQSLRAYFEQITTANGLPENSVFCMLQDHLGFMWLGTQNGLVRYDGSRMTVFTYDPNDPYSLKNNAITYLYEDRQGNIWVGCVGGLYRFDRATQRFMPHSPEKGTEFSGRFEFIYQDRRGSFWVITDKRNLRVLHQYNPKTDHWTHYEHNPAQRDGLAFTDVLIMSATGVRLACFLEDAQGDLWVVTRNGATVNSDALLHRYDRASDRFRPYQPTGVSATHPPLNYVKSPRLDRKGMIWVPTYGNGLYQINPVTNQLIAHYRNNPHDARSLISDTIRTLYEDRSGFLWISTFYGLDRLDPKTHFFTHFTHNPTNLNTPSDKVLDAFGETANGNIWFGTALAGIDEYDRKSGRFVRYARNTGQPGGLPAGKAGSFLIDQSDLIWAGTYLTGLIKQTRMTRFSVFDYRSLLPAHLASATVSTVYEAPSEPGVLWFGTNAGLDRYDKKTGKLTHYPLDLKNVATTGNERVSTLTEDASGRFWVGTTNGLYLMDRKRGTFIRYGQNPANANSLNFNWIRTILAARDGTLWIGTEYGLNQFNPQTGRFTPYYRADTLYHPGLYRFVNAIGIPERRLVSAWHTKGGTDVTKVFTLSQPTTVAILAMGAVTSAQKNEYGWIEDATGRKVWEISEPRTRYAGGENRRMQVEALHLPAGTYRLQYRANEGSAQTRFNMPVPTPYHPELWGFQVVKITSEEADTLTRLAKKWVYTGLSSAVVNVLHEDKKGRIWIGTNGGGLNCYDPATGKFTVYREPMNGFSHITTIHEDPNGTLWVGDYFHGLFSFNPDKGITKHYTTVQGLSHNSVMGIVSDEEGYLWLSTFNGLSRFDPATSRFRTYSNAHGLQELVFRYPPFKSSTGDVFFPGDQGISLLAKHQVFDDPYPPKVVLTDVAIFNQKAAIGPDAPLPADVSIADKITLSHDQNELTFSFAALHYNRSPECRYAFKLEPYDNEWVQTGSTRQARYTALNPGSYTFRVKAANADGVWNEKGARISVVILPPWWQTWWAYLLYALFIGGSIGAFIQYRSSALRRENRVLEEKVADRTNQLHQSLEQLKSTQTQLIQREKMASLGELTAGIAHEIQNPLNFVNNFSELNIELMDELDEEAKKGNTDEVRLLSQDIKQNLTKITHHGKRASGIVKGMLEHSRTSTGQKERTDLNALADEYLRLTYQGWQRSEGRIPGDPAKDFNAELITNFTPNLAQVEVIFQDMGRVLLNLYTNAFYAVSQKQKTALPDYQPTVTVSTTQVKDNVVIRVRDNGTGIPDSVKEKIFQPFFTTKPTGEGTGLGLSLSYDIVTKGHGGTLDVNSVPGEFTEFIIALPIG
jgi:ligand-binding sensor domain-containing protein/signal transduction histidine kinase